MPKARTPPSAGRSRRGRTNGTVGGLGEQRWKCFVLTESQSNDIYRFHVCDKEAPAPGEVRTGLRRHGNRAKRALLVLPAWLQGMTYLGELADIQSTSPR